jgi:hypothetical protein
LDEIIAKVPFIQLYDNDPNNLFIDIAKGLSNGARLYIRFMKNTKQIRFFYKSSNYTGSSDWEYSWTGNLN